MRSERVFMPDDIREALDELKEKLLSEVEEVYRNCEPDDQQAEIESWIANDIDDLIFDTKKV
jgi:hypothetical protein